jgi:uncharacterized radical SAM superfamily Fe-S cluster-containing enzyme
MGKNRFTVGAELPDSIGRCADLLHEVKQLRLDMDKEVAAVRAREREIEEHIISNLDKGEDTGASGLTHRVQVKSKTKPKPADWAALHEYIQEHGRFDLLQKRLAEKAVMDMLDEGEDVPGVERIHIPTISLTKIS